MTLTARADLAASYRQAGRTGDAIAILEQVAADGGRTLGPNTRMLTVPVMPFENGSIHRYAGSPRLFGIVQAETGTWPHQTDVLSLE